MSEKIVAHVAHIANELTGGVDGSYWAFEWHENNCTQWDDDDNETMSEHLDWCTDRPTAHDWLASALDIEYIVSSDRRYIGARVLVTFGGPNIWVNTRTSRVEGYWWLDEAHRPYADNLGLDDALRELWDMG